MGGVEPRRPILLPGLRRLWRDSGHLQLGVDPARAVLLELPEPGCARLLDLLDGSRTEAAVLREATRQGVPTDTAIAVMDVLHSAGLLFDARLLLPAGLAESAKRLLTGEAVALARQRGVGATAARPTGPGSPGVASGPRYTNPGAALQRRRAARVLITGGGQLAVPIASVLASSGVGHVDPHVTGITHLADAVPAGLLPGDAYRPRRVAAADAVRRAAPGTDLTPLHPSGASFTVLVGSTEPAQLTALAHAQRRLAHLSVAVRDSTIVVGPLVIPGSTPCLNCFDLHRRDRDPAWPALAAQLSTARDPAEPLAITTALAGVAYATAEVLTYLDGDRPLSLGATLEVSAPGRHRRRRWPMHPRCGCVRTPGKTRVDHRIGAT